MLERPDMQLLYLNVGFIRLLTAVMRDLTELGAHAGTAHARGPRRLVEQLLLLRDAAGACSHLAQ